MIVDEPQGAYYGGVVSAPIASKIFAKIFEFDDYYKNDETEKNTFSLETYIGLTLSQAAARAASSGLQYLVQGEGDYVTNQIPAPATDVQEGDVVLLIFD